MVDSTFDPLLRALDYLEQYGASTTTEVAAHLQLPLLKARSELKNAVALGFVSEIDHKWVLLRQAASSGELSTQLRKLVQEVPSGKSGHIARKTGLDRKFLDRWLGSLENISFKQDRRFRWIFQSPTNHSEHSCEERKDPQQDFIQAPLDKDLLVMAPPGTGKTHALVERLAWMSRSLPDPIDMASVCVLSFTNNAVNEITSRLKDLAGRPEVNDSVRYVSVRTFDSFAGRCLVKAGLPVSADFEKNILEFIKQLKTEFGSHDSPELLGNIRWLLIDEVQDLSGIRAVMVHTLAQYLMNSRGVYFSFLGDRHQGIYNHSEGGDGTESFVDYQKQIIQGRNHESYAFRKSYRYSDESFAEFMEKARTILDGSTPENDKLQQLIEVLPKLNVSAVDDFLTADVRQVAILTGRNTKVAQIAHWLKSRGIEYSVSEGAQSKLLWPLWVWGLFCQWKQPQMSRTVFMAKASKFENCEVMYQALQSQGVADAHSIYVDALSEQVYSHPWRGSEANQRQSENTVIVSTIHKAKGLQYDKVLVISDDCKFAKEDQARLLYVAMTRAKDSVYAIGFNELTESVAQKNILKGMDHYYYDSLFNFQHENISTLKYVYSLLSSAALSGTGRFKIKSINDQQWLCVFDGFKDRWFPFIRWYRQSPTTDLRPDYWVTIAWPDDDVIYKSVFGSNLLLPLPVFTGGK